MPRYGRSSRYGRRSTRYSTRSRRTSKYGRVSTTAVQKAIAAARFGVPQRKLWYSKHNKTWGVRGPSTETLQMFGPSYDLATNDQRMARMAHGYRGRGDYVKALGTAIRLGRAGVSAFRAGRASWRGTGDYEESGNPEPSNAPVTTYGSAVDNQLIAGGNAPMSVNGSNDLTGDVWFSHTEFVANIVTAGSAFENRTFSLNPGLGTTFPFLAQIARNFTLYDFEGLIFEYRPTSGEFGSSSNALGKVIMATNYDPDSVPFSNAINMANYDYAITTKPSLVCRHGVETDNKQQALANMYIRTGEVSRDKIFTDLGLFQFATEGIPYSGAVGELWVTYRVKLSRAKLSAAAVGGKYGHWKFIFTSNSDCFKEPYPWMDNINPQMGITFGSKISFQTIGSRIYFNPSHLGKYFLYMHQSNQGSSGPPATNINNTLTLGTGLQLKNFWGLPNNLRSNFSVVGSTQLGSYLCVFQCVSSVNAHADFTTLGGQYPYVVGDANPPTLDVTLIELYEPDYM